MTRKEAAIVNVMTAELTGHLINNDLWGMMRYIEDLLNRKVDITELESPEFVAMLRDKALPDFKSLEIQWVQG